MGISPKLLGADEHVVIHTRTHAKALIWPSIGLIVVGAAVGAGAALIPADYRPWGELAIAVLGLILATWWAVLPFLRWLTTSYTVTTRRLITRSGVLHRLGTDLPLMRINDVSYDRSLLDRMLGSGTLNVKTAAEGGLIVLEDVPQVERVHLELTELLFGTNHDQHRFAGGDGT